VQGPGQHLFQTNLHTFHCIQLKPGKTGCPDSFHSSNPLSQILNLVQQFRDFEIGRLQNYHTE